MKAWITLACRQVIALATAASPFERQVAYASYDEFLLKSQAYNPDQQYRTFTAMKAADGRANSLHYKSGFAVAGFVAALQGKMPHVSDSLGRPLPFDKHELHVIESDVTDKQLHVVSITYYTPELLWLDTAADWLLLTTSNKNEQGLYENSCMVQLKTGVSMATYRPLL